MDSLIPISVTVFVNNRLCSMLVIFITLSFLARARGLPDIVRLGALFDETDDITTEGVFQYAVNLLNNNNSLSSPSTKFAYDIQHVNCENSFDASRKACSQAGLGVVAIFGPRCPSLAGHINSMCSTVEVPHIEARADNQFDPSQQFAINVHPDAMILSRAYQDIVANYRWQRFCVIYSDQRDLFVLQELIRASFSSKVEVVVRQAQRHNMRETLKEVTKAGLTNIVIHLNVEDTYLMMKAALQVGMVDVRHHFILTNLDTQTLSLDDFAHNHVNVTTIRLVNADNPKVDNTLRQMASYQQQTGRKLLNRTGIIKTDAALIFDAVSVLARALRLLDKSSQLEMFNLGCNADQTWVFGSSLYNYLNLVELDGLTGRLTFDRGRRADFKLDVLQLGRHALIKNGEWSVKEGLKITDSFVATSDRDPRFNKTLIVTTLAVRQSWFYIYIISNKIENFFRRDY